MKKIALSLAAISLVIFALIAVTMMSNESANMHKHPFKGDSAQVQSGKYLFRLWEMGNRWKVGSGVRAISKKICFAKAFSHVPSVSVSFNELDVVNNANLRITLWTSAVNKKCFVLNFKTWSNTHIWSINASWVAHAKI